MLGCPAIALMQTVAWRLGGGQCGDPGNQFVLLTIGLQKWPDIDSIITKQAEVQFALR